MKNIKNESGISSQIYKNVKQQFQKRRSSSQNFWKQKSYSASHDEKKQNNLTQRVNVHSMDSL